MRSAGFASAGTALFSLSLSNVRTYTDTLAKLLCKEIDALRGAK
jgi:hypothetical protein